MLLVTFYRCVTNGELRRREPMSDPCRPPSRRRTFTIVASGLPIMAVRSTGHARRGSTMLACVLAWCGHAACSSSRRPLTVGHDHRSSVLYLARDYVHLRIHLPPFLAPTDWPRPRASFTMVEPPDYRNRGVQRCSRRLGKSNNARWRWRDRERDKYALSPLCYQFYKR